MPPIGPQSQSPKRIARKTTSGLSCRRCPTRVGVTNCASVMFNRKYARAGKSEYAPLNSVNPATPSATSSMTGPRYSTKFNMNAAAPHRIGFGMPMIVMVANTATPPSHSTCSNVDCKRRAFCGNFIKNTNKGFSFAQCKRCKEYCITTI